MTYLSIICFKSFVLTRILTIGELEVFTYTIPIDKHTVCSEFDLDRTYYNFKHFTLT